MSTAVSMPQLYRRDLLALYMRLVRGLKHKLSEHQELHIRGTVDTELFRVVQFNPSEVAQRSLNQYLRHEAQAIGQSELQAAKLELPGLVGLPGRCEPWVFSRRRLLQIVRENFSMATRRCAAVKDRSKHILLQSTFAARGVCLEGFLDGQLAQQAISSTCTTRFQSALPMPASPPSGAPFTAARPSAAPGPAGAAASHGGSAGDPEDPPHWRAICEVVKPHTRGLESEDGPGAGTVRDGAAQGPGDAEGAAAPVAGQHESLAAAAHASTGSASAQGALHTVAGRASQAALPKRESLLTTASEFEALALAAIGAEPKQAERGSPEALPQDDWAAPGAVVGQNLSSAPTRAARLRVHLCPIFGRTSDPSANSTSQVLDANNQYYTFQLAVENVGETSVCVVGREFVVSPMGSEAAEGGLRVREGAARGTGGGSDDGGVRLGPKRGLGQSGLTCPVLPPGTSVATHQALWGPTNGVISGGLLCEVMPDQAEAQMVTQRSPDGLEGELDLSKVNGDVFFIADITPTPMGHQLVVVDVEDESSDGDEVGNRKDVGSLNDE